MQKRLVAAPGQRSVAEESWLDLEAMAQVELTSEDPACPIEGALLSNGLPGWRAAEPGTQSMRLQPSGPRSSPCAGLQTAAAHPATWCGSSTPSVLQARPARWKISTSIYA